MGSGYCAAAEVTNAGTQQVGWETEIGLDEDGLGGAVTSLWNGTWTQSGQTLTGNEESETDEEQRTLTQRVCVLLARLETVQPRRMKRGVKLARSHADILCPASPRITSGCCP